MFRMRRVFNFFRKAQIEAEIDEELASHIEEAIERGRSATEARKAFGGELLQRERSRDMRLIPWLDALLADVIFGWRQLRKRPVVSTAAILSLALAIGATTAAFQLIYAALLRTLPVRDPQHLFCLAVNNVDRNGHPDYDEYYDYPTFRQYRRVAVNRADLMVIGFNAREDVTFGAGTETERLYRQFVSGNVFSVLGLQPAFGRLIAPGDDSKPGASPVAVLSYNFWTRRFGRDPKAVGTKFRMGQDEYQVVGVAPEGFIGTEPGAVTDVFIPAMMNTEALDKPGWSWFQIWVRPKPGFSPEQVRQPLQALFARDRQADVKQFSADTPQPVIGVYLSAKLVLLPASSGVSEVQTTYRRPLLILAALVLLVLLIACSNVGNLLAAQATSRAHELALRVSIGAGRGRLIQLVLVESAMLSAIASGIGTVFAWWSAPLVVSMLHVPEDPVRLVLDFGWRSLVFCVGLASSVTLLFGLAPGLQASGIKVMTALKRGERIHSRRWMLVVLAAQMAFCVLVQFVAGLFVSTFERLSKRPLGFSAEHVLVMEFSAAKEEPAQVWTQVADRLRSIRGVQSVALAGWPLLSRNRWRTEVRIPGHRAEANSPYVLGVSPGFFETMRIGFIRGHDFRPGDLPPRTTNSGQRLPGVGIVNEAFGRTYLNGENSVGRSVGVLEQKDIPTSMEIVGEVRDAAYYDLREPMRPTIYVPRATSQYNTFLIRTAGNPLALAPALRSAVHNTRPDLQVHSTQEQSAFVRWQMLTERLLGSLSLFFSTVALALAAIGLYGLLNYFVTGQRREIGIRMALGARPAQVVRRVTSGPSAMVSLGLVFGVAGGLVCGRFIENLLFEVKPDDPAAIAAPVLALVCTALLAALPPALRAVKIDPAQTLRNE